MITGTTISAMTSNRTNWNATSYLTVLPQTYFVLSTTIQTLKQTEIQAYYIYSEYLEKDEPNIFNFIPLLRVQGKRDICWQ